MHAAPAAWNNLLQSLSLIN